MRRLMSSTLPRRLFSTALAPATGAIALTFDDGPHPDVTPAILAVLAHLNVHATFFLIGMRAQRYPDLVRRIAAEGHTLANHTFTHADPSAISAAHLSDEVTRTRQVLQDIAGRNTRLFRPPHGKLTFSKLLRLWSGGHQIVLWNSDPKDFSCQSRQELESRVRQHTPHAGDIILLHDTAPYTPEVLPEIIQTATSRGLSFVSLADVYRGAA